MKMTGTCAKVVVAGQTEEGRGRGGRIRRGREREVEYSPKK